MNVKVSDRAARKVLRRLKMAFQTTGSDWFVRIATGSWFHFLTLKIREKQLEKALGKYGELSFVTKRCYDRFKRADLTYAYGRPLNKKQLEGIEHLKDQGNNFSAIRSAIVSDSISQDGNLPPKPAYALTLRFLGWFYNGSIILVDLVFTACLWTSHASFLNKAPPVLIIFVVHGFLIYQMSFYTTKPAKCIRGAHHKSL